MDLARDEQPFDIPWRNYRNVLRFGLALLTHLIERFERATEPTLFGPVDTGGAAGGDPYRTMATLENMQRAVPAQNALAFMSDAKRRLEEAADFDVVCAIDKEEINKFYREINNAALPALASQPAPAEYSAYAGVVDNCIAVVKHIMSNSGCTRENANSRSHKMVLALSRAGVYDNDAKRVVMLSIYKDCAQGKLLHNNVRPAFEAAWLGGFYKSACELVIEAVETKYLEETP